MSTVVSSVRCASSDLCRDFPCREIWTLVLRFRGGSFDLRRHWALVVRYLASGLISPLSQNLDPFRATEPLI